MSNPENFLTKLIKNPSFTLAVIGLTGFGMGLLFERNKSKAVDQQQQREKDKAASILKHRSHGNSELPAEFHINKEELKAFMEAYASLIAERKYLESIIPRSFQTVEDLNSFCSSIEKIRNSHDLGSLTKGVAEPIWDLIDRGGKRWRAILSMLIAEAYGSTIDDVVEVINLVELIHSGLVILEDIIDKKETRRGKPCVHIKYGNDISINAGCYIYFIPWYVLFRACEGKFPREKIIKIMRIYLEEMVNLHIGHAWRIQWNNSDKLADIPTEAQYLQMAAHKTGALARLSARMTCEILDLPRDAQKKLTIFSERIAVAFDIQNDILRLRAEGHISGEDISKGRMTLALIHNLNNATFEDKARLLDILQLKTNDKEHIAEAIDLLNKSDSINYARGKAEELVREAWDETKAFIPNNKSKGQLKALGEIFANMKICAVGYCMELGFPVFSNL